jgi:uncharacterized membrane protein
MRAVLGFVKTTVIGGLFFLVPLIVVLAILAKAYDLMKLVAHPLAHYLPVDSVARIALANLLTIVLIVLLCFLAGLLARAPFVRRAGSRFEQGVLQTIPIYAVVKSMIASMLPLQKEQGLQPVLVEFDDCSQLGLEVERQTPGKVAVYLPGSPNPWSGSLLMTTPERVTVLPTTMLATLRTLQQLGKGANALIDGARTAPPAGRGAP